jgi:hypothetical protein
MEVEMTAKKRELLVREGIVLDCTTDIFVRAEGVKLSRTRESSRYLILEGDFTEPLNGVSKFSMHVHTEAEPHLGNREIPSLGSILRLKPEIQPVVTLTPGEFQSLLILASGGKLRSVRVVFQKPHYGHALISSMSFSSSEPEGE